MSNKKFTERLNHKLDELEVPELMTERVQVCTRLFKLPRFKIEALLHGVVDFDAQSRQKIANELEVSMDWLFEGVQGKTKH